MNATLKYGHRTDCGAFEMKRYESDCGDCQTDWHYLCIGCRHLSTFDNMSCFDNMERYYPEQAKVLREAERLKLEAEDNE